MNTEVPAHCPNSDHDGARVPVTRIIKADPTTERLLPSAGQLNFALCAYCCEARTSILLRQRFIVTITPVVDGMVVHHA